jgi:hypothetical protein
MHVRTRALRRWLPAVIASLAVAPAARADTIDQTATGLRWYHDLRQLRKIGLWGGKRQLAR